MLLVDRGAYGTDMLSTHALMRGAVLQLQRWDVLPAIVAAGTPPVRSTTFSYRAEDVKVAMSHATASAPSTRPAGRCWIARSLMLPWRVAPRSNTGLRSKI